MTPAHRAFSLLTPPTGGRMASATADSRKAGQVVQKHLHLFSFIDVKSGPVPGWPVETDDTNCSSPAPQHATAAKGFQKRFSGPR